MVGALVAELEELQRSIGELAQMLGIGARVRRGGSIRV